jgi:hypothetical protein
MCSSHDLFQRQQFFALDTGGIMSGLRAVSAIFAAAAGLDTKQTAPLHFFATPMLKMNGATLRNEVEQWLMVEAMQLTESHGAATLKEQSTIEKQENNE